MVIINILIFSYQEEQSWEELGEVGRSWELGSVTKVLAEQEQDLRSEPSTV